ncbi:MAG: ABC transporter permease [Victivallaceae bacterium]
MDFLKRHYEKLILAILLVIFASLLVYLVSVVEGGKNITDIDLTPPTPRLNAERVDFSGDVFKLQDIFTKGTGWNKSVYRPLLVSQGDESENVQDLTPESMRTLFSDLMVPMQLGQCPFCHRYIPISFFKDGQKCLFLDCKHELKTPDMVGTGVMLAGIDVSIDAPYGLHKSDAELLGLDYLDVADVWGDNDGDGFSNLQEYLSQSDLKSNNSHPDLTDRLEVVAITRPVLPLKLNSVMDSNAVQITIGKRSGLFRLNSRLPAIGGREYVITQILPKSADNPEDKVVISDGSDVLELKRNADVTANRPFVELRDYGTRFNIKYPVGEGGTFNMFNFDPSRGGYPIRTMNNENAYRVLKIDEKTNTVTLEDVNSPGRTVLVDKESRIPENRRVGYKPNKILPNPNAGKKKDDTTVSGGPRRMPRMLRDR